MAFFIDIRIGVGLSELHFGSSMADADLIFGKADKMEELNDLEISPTILWHYYQLGFSLFFDANNDQIFTCVDMMNPHAKLWDLTIFDFTEKQIIQLFKDKGVYLYEQEHHDWGEKRLSFDKANIDFYFQKNRLVSVNYGLITEGTQTLILPN